MKQLLVFGVRSLAALAVWIMYTGLASAGLTSQAPSLSGEADGFAVVLQWDGVDPDARGVLLERCFDAPAPPAEPRCETAAVLQAQVRSLRHVGLRRWFFRMASFTAEGRSEFSPMTPLLGERMRLALDEDGDLPISASQIAGAIRVAPGPDTQCTDPATLLTEGYALVAAHPDFDGWRSPAEYCGTGGCIFLAMHVDADGCYRSEPDSSVQGGRAPWQPTAESSGMRQVCSSGGAGEGGCWLYEDASVVDQYLWWGGRDAGIDGLPADFNPDGHQTAVVPWPDWPVD